MYTIIEDAIAQLEYAVVEQDWDTVVDVIRKLQELELPNDENPADSELDITMDTDE